MAFRPRPNGRYVVAAVDLLPETAAEIEGLLVKERWENERPTITGLLRKLVEEALVARRAPRSVDV